MQTFLYSSNLKCFVRDAKKVGLQGDSLVEFLQSAPSMPIMEKEEFLNVFSKISREIREEKKYYWS